VGGQLREDESRTGSSVRDKTPSPQEDGKLVEDKHFLPLNLRWSHSEDHPKIAAGNVAPIDKTVELNVTGNWFDEEEAMFRDGIGLRVVS
jgi:hypothetical protein